MIQSSTKLPTLLCSIHLVPVRLQIWLVINHLRDQLMTWYILNLLILHAQHFNASKIFLLLGWAWASPTLIMATAPTHRIMVSMYLSMSVSFTPRLSHPGSWDPCTPWNCPYIDMLTCMIYNCKHLIDWTARATEQQGRLELLVSAVKIIDVDR